MNDTKLSLKSIYMLLMNEDFPAYSESVISRKERKGLTMLRFWQGIIIPEFRSQPCGQTFWHTGKTRNRYTSYLCNRSPEIKTYRAYARELSGEIRTETLRKQISRFLEFFRERRYRHDILLRRVRELIRLTRAEDPRVTEGIAGHILRAADWDRAVGQATTYQAAYLLTMLLLYAAAGEAMDGPEMALLQLEEYGIQALWMPENTAGEEKKGVAYLTVRSSLLQDNPLPKHRFFGREEELFELKEHAAAGRKCLILGMGGLGKTELLRQLIRVCEEERIVDKIAVVPYEGDIIESFARSFPNFRRNDSEESFRQILHRLTAESARSRILLLVDNLTASPETDPALEKLLTLPCSILISARRSCMEGMEVCALPRPSIGTGALIFRDNYGRPMDQEDRKCLAGMLEDEALCHPLTLRLMAGAARSKGWTVRQLKTQLEEKVPLSWQENDRTILLNQVYHQLYSYMQLPQDCRKIAELFTLLPRDSYPLEFLREWFPEVVEADGAEKLAALAEGGWLDRDETGFSMHPLIAQCLRRRVIKQRQLLSSMEHVVRRLCEIEMVDVCRYGQEQSHRIGEILCCATDHLSGSVSSELLCAFLRAGTLLMRNKQEKVRFLQRARRMRKRCPEPDDRARILYCTACGRFDEGDREEFLALWEKQKESRTVPERMYLDFCLSAGFYFNSVKDYETAIAFTKEALAEGAASTQRASAYFTLIESYDYSGQRENAKKTALEGAEYALTHPDCGAETKVKLLNMACQMETLFGNKEGASRWLARTRKAMEGVSSLLCDIEYKMTAANYEMYFGDLETAYRYYKETVALSEEIWEKDKTYYSLLGQLAIVLQRLKRHAEAVEAYLELLDYAKQTGDRNMLSLLSNNLSVAYLEMNRPQEALRHLDTAVSIARFQGGIALAEVLRNRARAFGQLGDRQREYACLTEAVPLLDAAYGPDHPRSVAAHQRQAELEAENPAQ